MRTTPPTPPRRANRPQAPARSIACTPPPCFAGPSAGEGGDQPHRDKSAPRSARAQRVGRDCRRIDQSGRGVRLPLTVCARLVFQFRRTGAGLWQTNGDRAPGLSGLTVTSAGPFQIVPNCFA
eukprot:799909-Prorocentrum_minimum.AAC.1